MYLVYVEHVYQHPITVNEIIGVKKMDWFWFDIISSHTCMK